MLFFFVLLASLIPAKHEIGNCSLFFPLLDASIKDQNFVQGVLKNMRIERLLESRL